jgi:hypothetical protein
MLRPGQNYDVMLVVYKFEKSGQQTVAPIPFCFHIALPVRTGLATFRHVRISVNTASFSPPTDSNSSSNPNSSRGYFYTDPKDRIITLEVADNNLMQSVEETAELYVPARTFLAYIAAHPPATVSSAFVSTESASPRPIAGARAVVDVPWEEWGPYGVHLVRTTDQTYIIRRPRACGMRVLGAPLSKKSVVVVDYHPGRVARSAIATVGANSVSTSMHGRGTCSNSAAVAARVRARAPIPAPAPAWLPVRVGTFSSESRSATGTTTLTRMSRCFPRLVCTTKEVPLPPELQKASESPWTMLCEDALLAFEVSSWIFYFFLSVLSSAEWMVFSTFQCTVCPGRLRNQQGVCIYILIEWGAWTILASIDIYLLPLSIDYLSHFDLLLPPPRGIQIHFSQF